MKIRWLLLFLVLCLGVGPGKQETTQRDLEILAEILTTARAYSAQTPESKDLVEGAIQGFLSHLDPHTAFYNPDRFATMREDQKSSFYGIGIHLGTLNNQMMVVAPIPDTPAARAGIRAGDLILAIDGHETQNLDVDEAIRYLRGHKGVPVRIRIGRPGMDEPLELDVERAEIPSENVRLQFMLNEQTGYVSLRDFGEDSTDELTEALLHLEGQGMQSLILDLRGNPGGLLPQAIGVAGLFLPGGKRVVSTKGRLSSSNQEFTSADSSPIRQVPLVVLIDRGSASASEIVAGAIQDYDRGLVLGITSWGKGLIQSVFPIGNGGQGLALTTARYYTPSGRNIQGSYDSWDEYYTPKDSKDVYFDPQSANLKPNQYFSTLHGRQVLQIRGILPDVYIEFEQVPEILGVLDWERNYFYEFAVAEQDMYPSDESRWPDDNTLLKAFSIFLKEQKVDLDFRTLLDHNDFVMWRIKYQLLFVHDSQKAFKFQIRNDLHVRAALELIPKAHDLFSVYMDQGVLPPGYGESLKQYARLHEQPAVVPVGGG